MSVTYKPISAISVLLDMVGLVCNIFSGYLLVSYPLILIVFAYVRVGFHGRVIVMIIGMPLLGLILRWFSKGIINRKRVWLIVAGLVLFGFSAVFGYLVITSPMQTSYFTYALLLVNTVLGIVFGFIMIVGAIKRLE